MSRERCEAYCTSSRNAGQRCTWHGEFDNYHQAVLCPFHVRAEDLAFDEATARRILRDRNRMWMMAWRDRSATA